MKKYFLIAAFILCYSFVSADTGRLEQIGFFTFPAYVHDNFVNTNQSVR